MFVGIFFLETAFAQFHNSVASCNVIGNMPNNSIQSTTSKFSPPSAPSGQNEMCISDYPQKRLREKRIANSFRFEFWRNTRTEIQVYRLHDVNCESASSRCGDRESVFAAF